MIRYLILFFALLSACAQVVTPPDNSHSTGQYQDSQITRLIVKPSDTMITAVDGVDQQAARAAFVKQAALQATGIEMQVLRHLATGAVLLELPRSVSQQQAKEYVRWIAQQTGIEYAEPDQRMRSMSKPNNPSHKLRSGILESTSE